MTVWNKLEKNITTHDMPGRILVRVDGYNDHTGGIKWSRVHYGWVHTMYNTPWGITPDTMKFLLKYADIPSIDHVYNIYWTNIIIPEFDYKE